jgi:23S rRNA (cytidine2498-2'-O)-methyltransferase
LPTLYLAPRFLEHELEAELTRRGLAVRERVGRLFLCEGEEAGVIWADDVWFDVQEAPVESISKAAKILRQYRIPFVHHSDQHHRRGELILDSVRKQPRERLRLGEPLPAGPWGAFSLPASDRMWISTRLRSPVPLGEAEFEENKTEPPSRAYLKLWEAMTVQGIRPAAGARVLDLGAAPGGWTWVLAAAGCAVVAVDKADLAPPLMRHPRVKHLRESAFGLDPAAVGAVDWLFSDIICYPERLLALVTRWRTYGGIQNFVCTVKFQGDTDWRAIDAFLAIPGSRLVHLYANKHELTWIRTDGTLD